jgi:hypothetical protein
VLHALDIGSDLFLIHRRWKPSVRIAGRSAPSTSRPEAAASTGDGPCLGHSSLYSEGFPLTMKPLLMIVGFLAAVLIIAQVVMGQLILQGQATLRTAHQHSGYLTVAVTLIYIAWSLAILASTPRRPAP